jgi:hypothetical protein
MTRFTSWLFRCGAALGIAHGLCPYPSPVIPRLSLALGVWCALVVIELALAPAKEDQ